MSVFTLHPTLTHFQPLLLSNHTCIPLTLLRPVLITNHILLLCPAISTFFVGYPNDKLRPVKRRLTNNEAFCYAIFHSSVVSFLLCSNKKIVVYKV